MIVIALLTCTRTAGAQEDPGTANDPSPDENATMTLHVYTNLIQIPVLILGPSIDIAPRFDPKRLVVTVDAKPLHPVHVRPEGDDPIALAILLDVSDDQNRLAPEFSTSLERLARSLHPQDMVAVYALDCTLTRVSDFAPPDSALLWAAGENARRAATPRLRRRRSCGNTLRLNDALAALTHQLWQQTGRRVVLAISGGGDVGSAATDEDVHQAAVGRGVAIFGISPYEAETGYMTYRRGTTVQTTAASPPAPQRFEFLCEISGGVARVASEDSFNSILRLFIRNVRERVIIEFPRLKDTAAGTHIIQITLPGSSAFIRSAGVTVPLPDAATLADPNTIHPGEDPPPSPAAPTPGIP